jgi:hypothetical protein
MARAPTRTHFHSARLVRVLTDLACAPAPAPAAAFAERLGLWVAYTDAIALCAVHNASSASGLPAGEPAGAALDIGVAFAHLRTSQEQAISRSSPPALDTSDFAPGAAIDITAAFEPYRRYYLAQQRDMDLLIGPMRARVREALAQASPALRQLAALDAALDDILVERESKLLYTLPQLLKKRFAHLLKTHRQALADRQEADQPDRWMQAGAWLARFCQELQTVLLAELDMRLQPTLGMIEAHHNKKTEQP